MPRSRTRRSSTRSTSPIRRRRPGDPARQPGPERRVIKTAGVAPTMLKHTGPAVIFESQEEAGEGILAGKVKAGDVVVIRYEGPKGGPGMQEMLSPTSYIMGAGLGESVALITDGRFSGGTAAPASAMSARRRRSAAPSACSRTATSSRSTSRTTRSMSSSRPKELADRKKTWKPPEPRIKNGYLAKYATMATSADTGAVLKW